MRIDLCHSCPRDDERTEGNCDRAKPDGFTARCGPPWTIIKHRFVEGYCQMFTKAMPNKFPHMSFIDLFSGPGLYYQWPSGQVFEGSPLIALRYGFEKYYFVDISETNINALKHRTAKHPNVEYLNVDVNQVGKILNNKLPPYSLSFCLADPDNMNQLKFATFEELTKSGRKVDLLINFPYWMYFKRSAKHLIRNNSKDNAIDLYFGTSEWKDIFSKHNQRFTNPLFKELSEMYLGQFYKIGYVAPDKKYAENYEVIRNTRGNPIYALLFLSKDQLGYKLWGEMVKYAKEIDLRLDL